MILALPLGQVDIIFCFAGLGLLSSIIGVFLSVSARTAIRAKRSTRHLCDQRIFALLSLGATLIFDFSIRSGCRRNRPCRRCRDRFHIRLVHIGWLKDGRQGRQGIQNRPAFTILSGFSYGLLSSFPAIIGIAAASLLSLRSVSRWGGYPLLGISMAAVGMLSVVGMIISNDAYGPIVDNARGLAEMGHWVTRSCRSPTSSTRPAIRPRRSPRGLPSARPA